MDNLVSIVIPVYNVEKYIRECLDSVINQTYTNLQIILVDDGSTDNSGNVCDEYAEKDNRITVIHQKNAGAGAAKNTGLDLVKGENLSIIDSDDYLELDMYETMINIMNSHNVDVVQCLFRSIFVDGQICSDNIEVGKKSSSVYLKEYIYDWKYALFWNKLYKTTLLKDIRFPVGRKIDDEFFTYKVISNGNSVYVCDKIFYNYRMRKSSVMNNNNQDRLINDRIDCFVERYKFIKENRPNLAKKFYEHLSDVLLYYKSQANSEELKQKLDKLIEIYPHHKPNIFKRLLNKKKEKREISVNNQYTLFD